MEKGEDKIQGMDFAYNLQGWLKGVNSTVLDPSRDIGKDGHSAGLDKYSGTDVNGFSLGYYKADYSPILGTNPFADTDYLMDENGTYGELFNGNISTMVTAMKDENEALITTQGNIYRYDLLQRIKSMNTYQVTDVASYNASGFLATNVANTGKYATTYSFDDNGNLLTLTRKDQAGTTMDNLSYNYIDPVNKNQLAYVDDAVTPGVATNDLDDQSSGNYTYDDIGQLTQDVEADIENIEWTADGKVREITFTAASGNEPIRYIYGAGGNRLVQITGEQNQPGTVYEYYVYDAAGNLMSSYKKTMGSPVGGGGVADYTETTWLKDRNMYGASRLGAKHENKKLRSRHFNVSGEDFVTGQTTVSTETHTDEFDKEKRILGSKFYEMSNHLGNVLNVITDRKLPNVTADGYEANVVSFSDYYPYGMLLPERVGSEDDSYRYGFQGQEMDDEIKGDGNSVNYKYRMHDPRIGRFFAVDPLAAKYPKWSPYAFSANQVIHTVELEGLEILAKDNLDPTDKVESWADKNSLCPDCPSTWFSWDGEFYSSTSVGSFQGINGQMLSGTDGSGASVWTSNKLASIGWINGGPKIGWQAVAFETQSGVTYTWNPEKSWYVDGNGVEFNDHFSFDITNMVGGAMTPAVQAFIDKMERDDAFYTFSLALEAHGGTLSEFVWDGFKQFGSDLFAGGHKGMMTWGSLYVGFLGSGGSAGFGIAEFGLGASWWGTVSKTSLGLKSSLGFSKNLNYFSAGMWKRFGTAGPVIRPRVKAGNWVQFNHNVSRLFIPGKKFQSLYSGNLYSSWGRSLQNNAMSTGFYTTAYGFGSMGISGYSTTLSE